MLGSDAKTGEGGSFWGKDPRLGGEDAEKDRGGLGGGCFLATL